MTAPPATGVIDEFKTRVTLKDTDAAGVIYMSAPSVWAQAGFENLLRAVDLPIEVLLARDHHYPVVSFTIEHRAPLKLSTPITVRTGVLTVMRRSVHFVTTVTSDDTGSLACVATRVGVAKSRSGKKVFVESTFRDIVCHRTDLGLPPVNEPEQRTGGSV